MNNLKDKLLLFVKGVFLSFTTKDKMLNKKIEKTPVDLSSVQPQGLSQAPASSLSLLYSWLQSPGVSFPFPEVAPTNQSILDILSSRNGCGKGQNVSNSPFTIPVFAVLKTKEASFFRLTSQSLVMSETQKRQQKHGYSYTKVPQSFRVLSVMVPGRYLIPRTPFHLWG